MKSIIANKLHCLKETLDKNKSVFKKKLMPQFSIASASLPGGGLSLHLPHPQLCPLGHAAGLSGGFMCSCLVLYFPCRVLETVGCM